MGLKGWVIIIFGAFFLSIVGTSLIQANRIKKLETQLSYSKANEKALFAENDSLEENSRTLYLTIEQLNSINDSIVKKMNSYRKEIGIKDKEIKELGYQLSKASKTDTLILRDTLFREPDFSLDTLLGNKWYSLYLSLEYPSKMVITPEFVSERYVSMFLKKETVNPPKKCAIGRLFQKKHYIMEVEVEEKNPYISVEQSKYIKIIE